MLSVSRPSFMVLLPSLFHRTEVFSAYAMVITIYGVSLYLRGMSLSGKECNCVSLLFGHLLEDIEVSVQ